MTNSTLNGRTFDIDLGPFVPRLSFLSDTEMRLEAQIGSTTIDEVVAVNIASVRPGLFVVAWTEKSGNFIVQVQDHQSGVVYNQARLADGQLFQAKGSIAPVTPA